jgi:polysaccharide export outer membrane protein
MIAMRKISAGPILVWLSLQALLWGQVPAPQQSPLQGGQSTGATQTVQTPPQNPDLELLRPNYVLRPGDQIMLRAFEMPDISERPFRIDGDGFINLPELGKVKAGGITVERLEASLMELLKKFVRQPQVTVTVVQFSSEPVFFVGAFKAPGIYPLQGRRTLVEMMSAIGGLQPGASRRIKLTRRKEYGDIPLPNAVPAPDGSGASVEINMASLRDNLNPAEDIVLEPFDVISVERAELVYVTGEVAHTGGFDLLDRDSMSVIQALTLAGGTGPDANTKTAWILRPISNTSRRAQITINLQRILNGRDSDRPLLPNDVLYVPKSSALKHNLGRTLLIVIPVAVSITSIAVLLTR